MNDLIQVPAECGWDKGRFWKDRLVPLRVFPFREHMPYIRCVCVNVALCRYELKLPGKKPDLSEMFYKADENRVWPFLSISVTNSFWSIGKDNSFRKEVKLTLYYYPISSVM